MQNVEATASSCSKRAQHKVHGRGYEGGARRGHNIHLLRNRVIDTFVTHLEEFEPFWKVFWMKSDCLRTDLIG